MRSMFLFFAVALIFGCSSAPKEPEPLNVDDAWLQAYTAVQEALADDDFERSKTTMAALAQISAADIKADVQTAADAGDIASMRTAFKPFSERLKVTEIPIGYSLVFCPMAFNDTGAHWVQKDGKIMNPYFGDEMLHCGAIIKARRPGDNETAQ